MICEPLVLEQSLPYGGLNTIWPEMSETVRFRCLIPIYSIRTQPYDTWSHRTRQFSKENTPSLPNIEVRCRLRGKVIDCKELMPVSCNDSQQNPSLSSRTTCLPVDFLVGDIDRLSYTAVNERGRERACRVCRIRALGQVHRVTRFCSDEAVTKSKGKTISSQSSSLRAHNISKKLNLVQCLVVLFNIQSLSVGWLGSTLYLKDKHWASPLL